MFFIYIFILQIDPNFKIMQITANKHVILFLGGLGYSNDFASIKTAVPTADQVTWPMVLHSRFILRTSGALKAKTLPKTISTESSQGSPGKVSWNRQVTVKVNFGLLMDIQYYIIFEEIWRICWYGANTWTTFKNIHSIVDDGWWWSSKAAIAVSG